MSAGGLTDVRLLAFPLLLLGFSLTHRCFALRVPYGSALNERVNREPAICKGSDLMNEIQSRDNSYFIWRERLIQHKIAASAFVGRTKAFCCRKTHCLFFEKGNREEILIMFFMIKGICKINPSINWVKNDTDLLGHFKPHKLIINCCKWFAWYLAPIPLRERVGPHSVKALKELILSSLSWDVLNEALCHPGVMIWEWGPY